MHLFDFTLIKIIAESMRPVLEPDTYALFRRTGNYCEGDIVLVDHPEFGRIVKKIYAIEEGQIWLEGISSQSTTRSKLGNIDSKRTIGRLVWNTQSIYENSIYG